MSGDENSGVSIHLGSPSAARRHVRPTGLIHRNGQQYHKQKGVGRLLEAELRHLLDGDAEKAERGAALDSGEHRRPTPGGFVWHCFVRHAGVAITAGPPHVPAGEPRPGPGGASAPPGAVTTTA